MLHGALGLMGMRAVGEAAVIGQGADIAKGRRDLRRHEFPELKLPHPRRVDEHAAMGVGQEPGGGRGMPPFVVVAADFAHDQLERRVDRVEQRRLPDAALADHCRHHPSQFGAESGDPQPGDCGTQHHGISHPRIDASQRNESGGIDEIELIDADEWPDTARFGGHDQPIDERRLDGRQSRAPHDQHLIDVGHDHMPATAARPTERRSPRLDCLNHTLLVRSAHVHPVAGCHRMPLCGGEGAEQSAGGATHGASVGPADKTLQAVNMQHLAPPFTTGQQRSGSGRTLEHDRPPAGEIALP